MLAKLLTRVDLLFRLVQIFGDILLLVRCPVQAAEVFEVLRAIAEDTHEVSLICEAYKTLGQSLQVAKQYSLAAKAYKLLLMHAWKARLPRQEVAAYHGLALQCFYMGYIRQAERYQERADQGFLEADHSTQKQMAITILERKRAGRIKEMSETLEREHGIT